MNDDLLRQTLRSNLEDEDELEALIEVEGAIEEKNSDDSFYDGYEYNV